MQRQPVSLPPGVFDRPVKITYGSGEVESFTYDKWGKLIATARGEQKATYQYDFFGRLTQKTENNVINRYTYNQWGQRISRETVDGAVTLSEKRSYDKLGRLTVIDSGTGKIEYSYNDKNQLARQTVNGIAIDFSYTKYGQLAGKYLGGQAVPMAKLQYFYSKDGMISGRMVDNELQNYTYDKKGQLLTVATADGKVVESYKYDPAGNILAKTLNGVTTSYTYDAANQLKTSKNQEKSINFAYDAAGRLVKENNKVYQYNGFDKVVSVYENNKNIASFNYHINGQIAFSTQDGKTENFLWDGLALIYRGETSYTNEPYVTGGNPLLSSDGKIMFNDMLGNTVGIKSEDKLKLIQMTAFGETDSKEAFFTGKPAISELGYAFLFRNYRADQGKWLSSDPMGYPDGWNNLAYCNSRVTTAIDWLGSEVIPVGNNDNFNKFVNEAVATGQASAATPLGAALRGLASDPSKKVNVTEDNGILPRTVDKTDVRTGINNYEYQSTVGTTKTASPLEALLHELGHATGAFDGSNDLENQINREVQALLNDPLLKQQWELLKQRYPPQRTLKFDGQGNRIE